MRIIRRYVRGGMALAAVAFTTAVAIPVPGTAQEDLIVSNFAAGSLTGWQEKIFTKSTRYSLVESDVGKVLMANSQASASGLFREMKIDLEKTPCLTWSWKVDGVLEGLNETTKKGDDYPARVYVIFSDGLFFWQTRALNYVWSSGHPTGSAWPNAYTDRSVNIAVQSGPKRVGQWVRQSRNVREDYRRLVGKDITQAGAVAIMTDTDDSGRAATAYYSDVRFTPSC